MSRAKSYGAMITVPTKGAVSVRELVSLFRLAKAAATGRYVFSRTNEGLPAKG